LTTLALVCFFTSCEKHSITNEKNNPAIDLNGLTFSNIKNLYIPYNIVSNIVDYNEIIGYDSTNYTFLISDAAGKRIRSKNYPVSAIAFAIAVDGEVIYIVNFIPGYSSMAYFDCITTEPFSYDNKYMIKLGYPSSTYYTGIDPRNDRRIISRLKIDNKLINISK